MHAMHAYGVSELCILTCYKCHLSALFESKLESSVYNKPILAFTSRIVVKKVRLVAELY